jgi:hypothetical protein
MSLKYFCIFFLLLFCFLTKSIKNVLQCIELIFLPFYIESPICFFWALDLKPKPRKIINRHNLTLEILDMGSLELTTEWRKTLNCGTLKGGVTVNMDTCFLTLCLYLQWMNVSALEVCKNAKNAVGKYCVYLAIHLLFLRLWMMYFGCYVDTCQKTIWFLFMSWYFRFPESIFLLLWILYDHNLDVGSK